MTSTQTEQSLTCNPCITFVQVLEEKETKPSLVVESSANKMSDIASDIKKESAAPEVTNGSTGSEEKLEDCKDGILDSDMTPSTPKKSNMRTRSKVSKASKPPQTAAVSSPLKDVKVILGEKINTPDTDSNVNNVNATGFHCEVCGKRFIKAQYLTRHARIHLSEYPYACDTCDKKFYRKDKLNSHLCTHKGELQSEKHSQKDKIQTLKGKLQSPNSLRKSEVQSQKRSRRSKLQSQKNLPKNKLVLPKAKCVLVVRLQKPKSKDSSSSTGIQCEECGKKFAARYHLNRHTMIHTGERPFPCDLCDKKFYRKDKLDKHKRTHKRLSETISRIFKQPRGRAKTGKRRKV